MYSLIDRLDEISSENCSIARYEHIKAVEKFSINLARIYGLDEKEVSIAAVGHDMFRDFSREELIELSNLLKIKPSVIETANPILLHGKLAAAYLKRDHNISQDVFQAIYWHVSGHPKIGVYGMVLMVADMGEETRPFPEADEVRRLAIKDLEKSYLYVIRLKVAWAMKTGRIILPETISTWNTILGGISCGTYKA